mgnify:CR=1 FL=1
MDRKSVKCVKCGGRAYIIDTCKNVTYNAELYGCDICQASIELVYETPDMDYETLKRYSFEKKYSK